MAHVAVVLLVTSPSPMVMPLVFGDGVMLRSLAVHWCGSGGGIAVGCVFSRRVWFWFVVAGVVIRRWSDFERVPFSLGQAWPWIILCAAVHVV